MALVSGDSIIMKWLSEQTRAPLWERGTVSGRLQESMHRSRSLSYVVFRIVPIN